MTYFLVQRIVAASEQVSTATVLSTPRHWVINSRLYPLDASKNYSMYIHYFLFFFLLHLHIKNNIIRVIKVITLNVNMVYI